MKEYLKKHGIKLGVIVLAVVLVALLAGQVLGGRADFLTNAIVTVREPIRQAASSVSSLLDNIYGYLFEFEQLKAENESLRVQLAEAQAEARAGQDALDENERFRNILGFAEKHSDFVMETARIVSWSADNWGSSFTISKGLRNGIEVGDCVVNEYGALVGQISELGESSAVVRTLIDVDTSIGALVGADGSAAMLMGDYTLMRQGQVKVTWLTEGAQLFLEDDVLTSGSGGLIPQGIVIGSVASIQSEAGGQTEYGIIQPAVDLDTLVQVFIIKEFDVTE